MALALRVGGCRALTTFTLCHIAPSSTPPASHFSLPPLSSHTPTPCLFSPQLPQRFALSNSGLCRGRFQNLVTRASDGEAAAVSVEDPPTADPPTAKPEAEVSPVELLDFRVGRVLKAWKHPEADGLFVEEVDVGEEEGPRTIVSGLVGYVPLEEMQVGDASGAYGFSLLVWVFENLRLKMEKNSMRDKVSRLNERGQGELVLA